MSEITIVIKAKSTSTKTTQSVEQMLDDLEIALKEEAGFDFVDISWTEE